MTLLRRFLAALARLAATPPPPPRLSGCEAHFAERLGLERSDRR